MTTRKSIPDDRPVGKLGVSPLSALADACAEHIGRARQRWAVCISPDGHVTLEHPDHVVPDDLAGVYAPGQTRWGLWRQIEEDMKAHVAQRPIVRGARRQVHRGPKVQQREVA
ncbi:MAG: hypothetical protein J7507_11905 [Pseudoxanthomonas sp.]|nr:hypothetical protein [Pseudoxanthomonas sp.]